MTKFKTADTHGAGPPIQAPIDELDAATVERCARAIWEKRPDCFGRPWPFDVITDKERRAYTHNPIAAVDLCLIYAKAASLIPNSAGVSLSSSSAVGESDPAVTQDCAPAETVRGVTANDLADHLFNHAEFTSSASWRAARALISEFDVRRK